MEKRSKKRRFESETMALPALRMVLADLEKNKSEPSLENAKQKVRKDFTEETVRKIINKLSKKD